MCVCVYVCIYIYISQTCHFSLKYISSMHLNNMIKDIFLYNANIKPKKINNSLLSSKISIKFPSLSKLFDI